MQHRDEILGYRITLFSLFREYMWVYNKKRIGLQFLKNKEQIKIIIGVIEKIMSILTKNNKKIQLKFFLKCRKNQRSTKTFI